jgi:hypothetical protein
MHPPDPQIKEVQEGNIKLCHHPGSHYQSKRKRKEK